MAKKKKKVIKTNSQLKNAFHEKKKKRLRAQWPQQKKNAFYEEQKKAPAARAMANTKLKL